MCLSAVNFLAIAFEPVIVEVRDSRTGYFIPVRYGLGFGQMGELSACRHRRGRRQLNLSLCLSDWYPP